jgi:hypothetical protein
MVRTARFYVMLFVVMILLVSFPAGAQWIENGAHVSAGPGIYQEIIPDGSGGAFITWYTDHDVYVQKLNAYGYKLWKAAGVPACIDPAIQTASALLSDEEGGIIVAWQDNRDGSADIYAQRIDAGGNILWNAGGVPVCTASMDQSGAHIVPDDCGGAIIAWHDTRNGFPKDIYAQRIDENGVLKWTPNGVSVCSANGHQTIRGIHADGNGGAIVVLSDGRDDSNDYNIYAQRIDAYGNQLWGLNGRAVCMAPGNQLVVQSEMVSPNRIIITWEDSRSAMTKIDIYAQGLDFLGNPLWTADGEAICTQLNDQRYPCIVPDGEGGAIIAWQDLRTGSNSKDIYAQRIDANGVKLWASWGVAVCSAASYQTEAVMVPDGEGGAIIAWKDYRDLTYWHIYTQRINADGTGEWTVDGVPVCISDNHVDEIRAVADGAGGALFAWKDWRNASGVSIYAQRIDAAGNWVRPPIPHITSVKDVPKDQGGKIMLQWERSYADTFPNTEITHYSAWRRLPKIALSDLRPEGGANREPIDIPADFAGPAVRATSDGYAWEWLENVVARYFETYALTVESLYDSMGSDPGWQYFMVSAHTSPSYIYYDSPVDSGYSVDNLAPAVPKGFAGVQSSDPEGLELNWLPNTEADLSHYNIYRSTYDDFRPGPDNLIAMTRETAYFDHEWHAEAGYLYRLAATDVHGNTGPTALLEPTDIKTGTLLHSYSASILRSGIELSWILSESGTDLRFFIQRSEGEGNAFKELPSPAVIKEGLSFTFRDTECEPGTAYRYRVECSDENERRVLFETDRIVVPPMSLTLHQNHPNPFNPTTNIRYYLPEKCMVTLDIYDISGRIITRLVNEEQPQGSYVVEWTGRDEKGLRVSSGVFFYRLRAGKETRSRKMVLMR